MLPICLESSLLGGKHFLPAEKCPKFDQFEGQTNRKLWIASIVGATCFNPSAQLNELISNLVVVWIIWVSSDRPGSLNMSEL